MKVVNADGGLKNLLNPRRADSSLKTGLKSDLKSVGDLNPGDKFKANIVNITPSGLTLRLEGGGVIEAKSMINPDAHIGDDAIFLVTESFKGQILLEIVKPGEAAPDMPIVSKGVIREALIAAEMPLTSQNAKLVQSFIESGMPIDPKTLQAAAFFMYSDPKLTMEQVKFLVNENFPAADKTIEMFNAVTDKSVNLLKNINELMQGIYNIPDKSTRNELLNFLSLDGISDILILQGDDGGRQAKEDMALENLIKQASELLGINTSDGAENPELKGAAGQNALSEPAEDINNNQNGIENGNDLEKAVDAETLLKNVELQTKDREAELARLVRDRFFIDLDKDSLGDIPKTFKELHKSAEAMLQIVKQKGSFPEVEKALADIKNNIEFMNKINNFKEYMQIPFQTGQQENECELHVFGRQRKGRGGGGASALVALDYPFLKHVEVFITKNQNKVTLQFKAENSKILGIIGSKINMLSSAIAAQGCSLSGVSYKKLKENFELSDMPEGSKSLGEEAIKRYSVDMRV